jgi:hypothetical protein
MPVYRSVFLAGIALLLLALPARTQTPSARPGIPLKIGNPPATGLGGFESARFTGPGDNFLQEYLRQSAERSFANANLAVYSERFLGIERYQATGLELALEGIGTTATLGLFAGAVANTAGLWDEDTSWYIVGAAAALGAVLGYSRVNDPKKRTRYRWSIDIDSADRNP